MQELSAEECQTCKEALKSLVGKVYQPMMIKELLILQGGPKQVCVWWWGLWHRQLELGVCFIIISLSIFEIVLLYCCCPG